MKEKDEFIFNRATAITFLFIKQYFIIVYKKKTANAHHKSWVPFIFSIKNLFFLF